MLTAHSADYFEFTKQCLSFNQLLTFLAIDCDFQLLQLSGSPDRVNTVIYDKLIVGNFPTWLNMIILSIKEDLRF